MIGVRDQLVQVLLNLILNAIDATDIGGQIVVRAEVENKRLVLHVEDTAPALPPNTNRACFSLISRRKSTAPGWACSCCAN